MILHMFSVRDSASELFGRPFFATAPGAAARSFKDEVMRKEPGNDLAAHPDDFTLYHLGQFDDSDGAISIFEKPEVLLRGKDVAMMLGAK